MCIGEKKEMLRKEKYAEKEKREERGWKLQWKKKSREGTTVEN